MFPQILLSDFLRGDSTEVMAVTRSGDHRPFLPSDTFSRDKRFKEWMDCFENVAVVNHSWNNGEKVLWLRVALKGEARMSF